MFNSKTNKSFFFRTSYELEVILNHNPEGEPWEVGDFQTLERLKLAIKFKQKSFVAHPSVQQLLASIWYEGLPGFRRKHIISQVLEILKLCCSFPFNSLAYIIAPNSARGKFMRNPFVKFTSHSASYLVFLLLLALASQQIEHIIISVICFFFPGYAFTNWLEKVQTDWIKYERGALPHFVELTIILWVQGLVWVEIKNLWKDGLIGYLKELWNIADLFSYGAFLSWIGLRVLAWIIVQKEQWDGVPPDQIWTPKEEWHSFEPNLLAEAMFAAGMIGSYLKVTHILSINPYLGPLQIALGKMIIDIIKWMFLYILVVFAYGCGMNQLLWYYSDLERQECFSLPGGEPDYDNEEDACGTWRRFSNLWETSQSLFWASFGLVDLGDFDLKGISEFTRYWGLLMFGSYSVCNIIVLLNMLIAMMSNSYQIIFERSDIEWKFSRSKLWISYFNPGSTVPPPFNLLPSPKSIFRIMCCRKHNNKPYTDEDVKQANNRYHTVMKFIIRRYVTSEQRKSEDYSITEDDIQEVRQDISSFKYELIDILKTNKMIVPTSKRGAGGIVGRKSKNMERQIQKGFNISNVEGVMEAFYTATTEEKPKDVFKRFAKIINETNRAKRREEEGFRRSSLKRDQIGSTQNSIRRHRNSLKKTLLLRGNSQSEIKMVLTRLNSEELVAFNPQLSEYPPSARRAYAKFKVALDHYHENYSKGTSSNDASDKQKKVNRDSIRKLVMEKAKSIDSENKEEKIEVKNIAADLEKIIDKNVNEQTSKESESKTTQEKFDGIDNAGFVGDELQVNLIPPSQQGSIDETELLSTPSKSASPASSQKPSAPPTPKHASRTATPQPSTSSAEGASIKPPGSPGGASIKPQRSPGGASFGPPCSPGGGSIKPPGSPDGASIKPPTSPGGAASIKPTGSTGEASIESHGSPSGASTKPSGSPGGASIKRLGSPGGASIKPPGSPGGASIKTPGSPGGALVKPPGSPGGASTTIPITPANVSKDEPIGKFDPDGKSAVSGQKRTGWI